MFDQSGFFNGLSFMPLLSSARSRSISAENPRGEKGGGAREIPDGAGPASDLGQGWKVRPCVDLKAGETFEMADIEGPGVIRHIWMTVSEKAYRNCILRFHWDGEKEPSVEVPLGDFFCHGHGIRHTVNSMPVCVNPSGGFNSYWPMPFTKRARITVENLFHENINHFYYQVDYSLTDVPAEAGRFHASWRRSTTEMEYPEHSILDGVAGQGHYVGTFLAWTQLSNGWWGEGEIKFFMDGDGDFPTVCGTGTEDYFGGAWGFYGPEGREETFSTPFLGLPFVRHDTGKVPAYDLYRWHIMDPVHFQQDLKVTIQALGWWPNGKFQPLRDDIASTAFWYQSEPHRAFPQLPPVQLLWPR